jgi:Ser/Thr protein kinase RdoA (MazF antagonist)
LASTLDTLLAGSGEPALRELRTGLERHFGAPLRVLSEETIKSRVHRLGLESPGFEGSVVVKRMNSRTAEGNRLLAERWLPAAGLAHVGPPLLATFSDPEGRWLWQLYADLGDRSLADAAGDASAARQVAEVVAEVHARFASHPLLPEARLALGDRGALWLEANARDALSVVEGILAGPAPAPARAELCERIAGAMRALLAELPERRSALERSGGPETLLHGDLWTTNAFPLEGGARLIDWDRAGVGPAVYDLSTLLMRFDADERVPVLDAYRAALARHGAGFELGPDVELAFDSAEQARVATRLVWPAVAVATGEHPDWGWDELARVGEWLDQRAPVLA